VEHVRHHGEGRSAPVAIWRSGPLPCGGRFLFDRTGSWSFGAHPARFLITKDRPVWDGTGPMPVCTGPTPSTCSEVIVRP